MPSLFLSDFEAKARLKYWRKAGNQRERSSKWMQAKVDVVLRPVKEERTIFPYFSTNSDFEGVWFDLIKKEKAMVTSG